MLNFCLFQFDFVNISAKISKQSYLILRWTNCNPKHIFGYIGVGGGRRFTINNHFLQCELQKSVHHLMAKFVFAVNKIMLGFSCNRPASMLPQPTTDPVHMELWSCGRCAWCRLVNQPDIIVEQHQHVLDAIKLGQMLGGLVMRNKKGKKQILQLWKI